MKLKKVLGYGLGSILALSVLAVGGGLIWRSSLQGEVRSARSQIDPAKGVDELFKVKIGGIDQWFHSRGVNKADPVLLWLHGGPGTTMMPFASMFQNDIEKHYIVVHWDQRASGKTYFANATQSENSYDRMLKDAVEAVAMVKKRYGKDRVVIVGHSWGSMLGLGLVQAVPQDISAYIGTGQVVDISRNEAEGYKATLAEARRLNNALAVKELTAIAPYPEANGETLESKTDLLRKWENAFGFGISRRYREKIGDTMIDVVLASPEYSVRDISYYLNTPPTAPQLEKDVDAFKASKWSADYKVPMFQFLGRHDWQTPSTLAAPWFDTITAPSKKLIWFEKSAHSPMVDEPEAFAKALIEQVRPVAMQAKVGK
jgi:proline iminopeptidase